MTRPILLQGGHVIDPSRDLDEAADVLIQDGKISDVKRGLSAPDGADVRNVKGKVVVPGLIDLHVHLREPGNEDEETVATGAHAAAGGGARLPAMGPGAIGKKGERLAELGEMVSAGAVAVSDDGKPVASSHLMRTALEYARTFDIQIGRASCRERV